MCNGEWSSAVNITQEITRRAARYLKMDPVGKYLSVGARPILCKSHPANPFVVNAGPLLERALKGDKIPRLEGAIDLERRFWPDVAAEPRKKRHAFCLSWPTIDWRASSLAQQSELKSISPPTSDLLNCAASQSKVACLRQPGWICSE